jgi:hypothetical protein
MHKSSDVSDVRKRVHAVRHVKLHEILNGQKHELSSTMRAAIHVSANGWICKKVLSPARLELAALGYLLRRAVICEDMRPT